jgi:anti-sigma factor RsiW
MQCQHARELFSDYVGDQLDRPLMVSVDSHLQQCSSCREAVAGMRRLWTDLDQLPAVEPPPFFHENLMHRINAELDSQEANAANRRALWNWRALLRPRALAPAFCLALILLFAGAGILHTQSAGMWPLSLLGNHAATPHVAIQGVTTQWTQDEANAPAGTLTISLQLDGATASGAADVDYTITVEGAAPSVANSATGAFLPNGAAIAHLKLSAPPEAGRDTLVVTVTRQKDGAVGRQTWRQPIQIHN